MVGHYAVQALLFDRSHERLREALPFDAHTASR